MMKKQEGAGGVLFIVLLAIVSAGLIFKSMMVENLSEEAESEVTGYAQQFLTIQNRAMHFYKDNGLWPGSLQELNSHDNGKYNTGITVSITGNDFVFDTSSGWLQIQSNTNDRSMADSVASLLVSGESNNGVVSSTLKNPYEVDAYEDYLQKVANPDDPSRTRLETDVDFNHNELTNAGNVDGESIDFNEYEGERASTEVATVDDKARIGQAELTAIGRSLNINGGLSFRDMKAQVARFNELEVERGDASQFEGDDFSTQDTSLNAISYQASALQNKLDECMYVTEWCFPKAPKITQTECEPSCNQRKENSAFSTRIKARVTKCQHGCNYTWQLGSASGSCSGGSIGEGGWRNLACDISGAVPPESTRSHAIKLRAVNAVDTSKRVTSTIPVSWENITSDDPFEDIKAGCFIDYYYGYDLATENGCAAGGPLGDSDWATAWSVGNIEPYNNGVNDRHSNFQFSDDVDVTVKWSGDCVSNTSSCLIYTGYGKHTATATVTINGKTRTFTVTSTDLRQVGPVK